MAMCICGRTSEKDQHSITCNNCQRFIHLECAQLQKHQADEIYIFYCEICRPYTGPSVVKTITNSHRHDRNEQNAESLPIQTGTPDFINYLKKSAAILEAKPTDVKNMRGQQLTLKELIISGFDKPILVDFINGLEMSVDSEMNFNNLSMFFPADNLVEAIEITRQIKVKAKIEYFVSQFKLNLDERQDIYSIRINMSKNFKNENFIPPRIVRKISWVDAYWPDVPFKPLLSKYCFLSMKNAFNDFHMDIGGSSAWFHVIEGEQVFYVMEPSVNNWAQFEKWINLDNLHEVMFCKNVENIFKIKVSKGQTIFIPNGWIYSVLSTQDSIVFGGYFLHSLNISAQIKANDFLKNLNKPQLDFPSYELTNWYAAPNILKLTKDSLKNQPPKHLSKGIEALIDKLKLWLHKSKSKRNETQMLVPKAVNCSKIIRDLNRCLRKNKKKVSKEKDKLKLNKEKAETEVANKPQAQQPLAFNPEETKIKDIVNTESSSNLKIKFNMKLAQDVIRRSLDDPYDMNSDQNGKELLLLEPKKNIKSKKRKHHHENEVIKLMENTKRQDDDYIYYDADAIEEKQKPSKSSGGDEIWEPGPSNNSSGNSKTIKKNKTSTTNQQTQQQQQPKVKIEKQSSNASNSINNNDDLTDKSSLKKHRKGLATPKQRLAKKLKMSM